MSEAQHYAIRGGIQGRERLRILSRAMQSSTTSLFERLGVGDGLTCLDVGCERAALADQPHRNILTPYRADGDDALVAISPAAGAGHGLPANMLVKRIRTELAAPPGRAWVAVIDIAYWGKVGEEGWRVQKSGAP